MAYVLIAIVVLAIIGLVVRAVMAAQRPGRVDPEPGGSDVTDTSVRPTPPSGRPTR